MYVKGRKDTGVGKEDERKRMKKDNFYYKSQSRYMHIKHKEFFLNKRIPEVSKINRKSSLLRLKSLYSLNLPFPVKRMF